MEVEMLLVYALLLWALLCVAAWIGHRRGRLSEDFHRDLLALGALGLLAIGFFWRPLLASDVWMPADGGDLASFLYPTYRFTVDSLRQGILPLWNPHLYTGMTFVGDIQSGLLYPPYWLLYLLTPQLTYEALQASVVFHIFVAGGSMYLCLRFLRSPHAKGGRLKRLACLAGGVAFMFSDLFIIHFGNLNMVAVAAWLPLLFVLFHRALADRRFDLAVGSGAVFALATLAGHIQISLFLAMTLGLRTLWEIAGRWRLGREKGAMWQGRLRPLGYLALAGLTGFGLCAPILLPSLQHAGFTERIAWSYGETVQYSLSPGQYVSLLVPAFFGRGPAFHWGLWDRVEVGYIGIMTLFLAVLGVLLRREKVTRFMLCLAVLAYVAAMGVYALLHGWLYQLIPGFDQMRAPARFVLLTNFAVAILAGFGLDALLRPLGRRARYILRSFWRYVSPLALGGTLLLWGIVYLALISSQDKDYIIFLRLSVAANGVGLLTAFVIGGLALIGARRYGRIRPHTLGILAAALIFFDLSSTGSYIDLGSEDPTARFQQPAIVSFLRADPTLFRIDARTDIDRLWQPNTAVVHGLYDVWGIANPLAMGDTVRYWSGLGSRSTPLYDALNAKYVIARKDVELDWERFVLTFDGDPYLNVYENRHVLPRAWVVHRSEIAGSQEQAFVMIQAPEFDPSQTVVLEAGIPLQPASPSDASVLAIDLSPNRITVDLESDTEGVLVLSEVFYPGWKASLNGQPADVMRANYLFRGVRVPAGRSRVELTYAPASWWLGVALAGLTLAGMLLWVIIDRRRRTRVPHGGESAL